MISGSQRSAQDGEAAMMPGDRRDPPAQRACDPRTGMRPGCAPAVPEYCRGTPTACPSFFKNPLIRFAAQASTASTPSGFAKRLDDIGAHAVHQFVR